jgi:hypothetical protein
VAEVVELVKPESMVVIRVIERVVETEYNGRVDLELIMEGEVVGVTML